MGKAHCPLLGLDSVFVLEATENRNQQIVETFERECEKVEVGAENSLTTQRKLKAL